ncbi:hypothetical protein N7532_011590 [Penicillium argentinense]|uniref:Glycine zipper 2TM domain-containing protein n=1 Tax=Penicillium argentinense TaxID=1131581 RepID=A0A9W9JVD8_9EURO|nr:uncharacterized protein N7532_011590 [Penicillium argentinense]KAJ5082547.1 hypothetical protein N7532_011590 [Penicillium argentinense]
MADPYNPYSSYQSPTPGGVSYYPPDDQSHQQAAYPYPQQHPQQYQEQPPFGTTEYGSAPPPDPNYTYAPQPSPYHLAPDGYQNNASDRSYTPVGQPDYLGPVSAPGMPPQGTGKVPENMGYYDGHPADQPRYTPSHSPQPPPVYVSEADKEHTSKDGNPPGNEEAGLEGDRGLGSSLAGGAAGYYFGHKRDHGLLGAIGGAILGNFLEDKVKDHRRNSNASSSSHGHHGHGHHHHHHHHRHSRSRSHSRHRGEDDY